jgi:hypothetical protein
MADEPVEEEPIYEFEKRNALRAFTRNRFRAKVRPHLDELEAREQALLARVAELEALLASLYAPIQTTFGATLEGRTQK